MLVTAGHTWLYLVTTIKIRPHLVDVDALVEPLPLGLGLLLPLRPRQVDQVELGDRHVGGVLLRHDVQQQREDGVRPRARLVHGGGRRHPVVGALLQLLHRRLQRPHLQLRQAGDADALDGVLPEKWGKCLDQGT